MLLSLCKQTYYYIHFNVNLHNNIIHFDRDILHCGMEKDMILNGSDLSDCILCTCIADINMDGQNEILLGTYGQEVLIFALSGDTWELSVRKLFDAPVHSISYMDITNDGMKELIVLTQRGVHILQVTIFSTLNIAIVKCVLIIYI